MKIFIVFYENVITFCKNWKHAENSTLKLKYLTRNRSILKICHCWNLRTGRYFKRNVIFKISTIILISINLRQATRILLLMKSRYFIDKAGATTRHLIVEVTIKCIGLFWKKMKKKWKHDECRFTVGYISILKRFSTENQLLILVWLSTILHWKKFRQ